MPVATVIRVTVVHSPAPREVMETEVVLAPGSTVADAIRQCGELAQLADIETSLLDASLVCGIWSRKAALTQTLKDGDRVEICRPLRVDPKVARRLRFAKQGARATGLFAMRRQGAKPGY